MADEIVAQVCGPVQLVPLADSEGCVVYFEEPSLQQFRARGLRSITMTFSLDPGKVPEGWLRVKEAARQHVADIDGMTVKCAVGNISRACSAGKIACQGNGPTRRIEPNSLAAWRLAQRVKALDRLERKTRQFAAVYRKHGV